MNLIVMGGPACGKGVQTKHICEKYDLLHISTGDLLREVINSNTTNSQKIKEIITTGNLVSDDLIYELVLQKLSQNTKKGYVLDGFPRTSNQALMLDVNQNIDAVILLETDYETTLKRVLGRRVCVHCKASLNVDELKGKRCPYCSGAVSTRLDDNETTFKKRYEIYKMQSAPLIKYYEDKGILYRVLNNSSIDETSKKIDEILSKLKV